MDADEARIAARKSRVRFLLLGPVEIVVDGQAVKVGGTGVRGVLAMLLLEPNEVVPLDRIVDALWAGKPPVSAQRRNWFSYVSLSWAPSRMPENRFPGRRSRDGAYPNSICCRRPSWPSSTMPCRRERGKGRPRT